MKMHLIHAALCAGLACAASANAQVVVVVNAANPVSALTQEQISELYLGKSKDLTPIDQAKDSETQREFLEKVVSKKSPQYEAVWAKLEFSGKGIRPKTYPSDAAVKKALAADRNAIGYIDKSSVDGNVKVVHPQS
ncbi:hypothetical protein [Massilia sp. DD77]|uniref:hypothetical protein n=1 Tax=Massilia sp. DD77 TaxID=3109349 RepID=UPI002FFE7456